MKQRELREKMPVVAEIIDHLVEHFDRETIHSKIRRGIDGEATFWAMENGIEIGTKNASVPVQPVAGRAISIQLDMPSDAVGGDWFNKMQAAMDLVAARLEIAAHEEDRSGA